jgi:hypothetical protein
MTMLMMDLWITGRSGGGRRKNTHDEGEEEVNERKNSSLMIWYLPMIDLLKHLFSNIRDAKLMIWHATTDGCKKDGKLQHSADAR